MGLRVLGLCVAAVGMVSCGGGGGGGDESAAAEAQERAGRAADELMGTLLPELQTALAEGGPAAAVEVCSARAQALTEAVEARHEGVRIRRTSLRVRNEANEPDAYERAWLERAAESGAPAATAEVVEGEAGRELRFLRPIMLAEMCVQCHGPAEAIGPEVRAVLAERYPGDAATGFRVGELRGAVSVRVGLE